MPRAYRARASRALLLAVTIAIIVGVGFQLHRIRARNRHASQQVAVVGNWPVTASHNASKNASKPVAKPAVVASVVHEKSPATQPARLAAAHAGAATVNPGSMSLMAVTNGAPAQTTRAPAVVSSVSAEDLLKQAAKQANGSDLLGARKTLNDAIIAGTLSPAELVAAKKQIAGYNQTIVFSTRQFPNDPFGGTYVVQPGQRLASIAQAHAIPWQLLLQLNGLSDPRRMQAGQHLKIIKGPISVVVTKHAFNMDLYIGPPGGPGSMYLTSFPVGLGTSNSTPAGTWIIQDKVSHPTFYGSRGQGVIAADDPKNPLGPCWMGLEGTGGKAVGAQSYGIHGTIDPKSIGTMSSLGCIRMHNQDVKVVFALLVKGKSMVLVKD